ncbi:MAG TPA: S8 family serine peptidase [Bryobacteraceae bacterium]|nr:S8 family serine peptidase [Bryobacteraceae bacterium]
MGPRRTVAPRAAHSPQLAYTPNRYAVFLTAEPVIARYTARESLRTAAAVSYKAQVERAQAAVKNELASRNIRVVGSVSTLLNAVFVSASPDRLAEIKAIPGVAGVMPMRTGRRYLNVATQLMNAAPPGNTLSTYTPAWSLAPGGSAQAGAGIKVAIIDSGIDQNNPAFQDSSLAMPAGFPKCNSDPTWSCSNFTNNKVIVARSYVRQISAYSVSDPANPLPSTTPAPPPATSAPDDFSPRDRDGHGTAVASTVAAMYPTAGVTVPINGMAPKAYLGNYKVYGSPGVNDYPPEDVYIQALDDAINDGMDVVNFSSGAPATTGATDTGAACGNAAGVPCDPLAYAFEAAAASGEIIVAAAGNSGVNYSALSFYPIYSSVGSPATAPSVISVGATVNGHAFGPSVSVAGPGAPANLQNIVSVPSDSQALNLGGLQAPLVDVSFVGDAYACSALPANSLVNSFALVERGPTASPCAFATKAANAQAAGAIGMILYAAPDSPSSWNTPDPTYNYIETVDQFVGPLVGISNTDGVNLKNYIDATAIATYMANGAVDPWPLVTMDMSGAVRPPDPPGLVDSVATYSSVGPTVAQYPTCATCAATLLKPDMVAIGGGDYQLYPDPNDSNLFGFAGLYTAAESYDPNGEVYSSTGFAAVNGTSFASPMTAGAAALVKQLHPTYTAAQVKSALVNWSNPTAAASDDFGNAVDVRQTGAGLLDAGAAVQATVTAKPSVISFGAIKTNGALPAAQVVTITNSGTSAVNLTVAVAAQLSANGATVSASPATLQVQAGGTGTITVSITGSVPAAGAYYGSVNVTGSGATLHIPYLFQVGANVLGTGTSITGNVIPIFGTSFDGIEGQDIGAIAFQVVDASGLPVSGAPVSFYSNGGLTMKSVAGEPACSPASSSSSVICNTDNYGIAYTDLTLGASVATPTIRVFTANSSVTEIDVSVNVRAQPTIPAGGVRDAAQAKTTIAPGSYISIYGTGLCDYIGLAPSATLPMMLNYATVSFDAPAANISVPGTILYTSPTQINVQVPWELQGLNSTVQMKVTLNEYEYGNVVSATVADVSPSFFETTQGSEVAALVAGTYMEVTQSTPAPRGAKVQIYANGLGPVNNQPASGAPGPSTRTASTKNAATLTIGGLQAAVSYCGLAPGYPGLYEIDATVPTGIGVGAMPVSLSIGGQTATSTINVN